MAWVKLSTLLAPSRCEQKVWKISRARLCVQLANRSSPTPILGRWLLTFMYAKSIAFSFDGLSKLTSCLQNICATVGDYEIIESDEQLLRIVFQNYEDVS